MVHAVPAHDPCKSALLNNRAMIALSLSLLSRIALRFRELIVVVLRVNRVGHCKRCQCIVKGVALSNVSSEHRRIAGTRMRAAATATRAFAVSTVCADATYTIRAASPSVGKRPSGVS
jgi:hypothetical protein